MTALAVSLHARACVQRCPLCREDLASTSHLLRMSCEACGVTQHVPCVVEAHGCATFGCPSGAKGARPARPRARPGRADESPQVEARRRRHTASMQRRWSFALAACLPLAIGLLIGIAEASHVSIWSSASNVVARNYLPIAGVTLLLTVIANFSGMCLGLAGAADGDDVTDRVIGVVAALLNALPWIVGVAWLLKAL